MRAWTIEKRQLSSCALACALVIASMRAAASAAPVKVRYPEGPTHGFLSVSDMSGKPLGHGDLTQWLERRVVASRLVFKFEDGSLYDETLRFTQSPVFRVVSYHLIQRGPSFPQTDVEFDASGRYHATTSSAPGDEAEHASGRIDDMPDDLTNGMISTVVRNLEPGTSTTTHLLAFRPKPIVLEAHFTPEGTGRFHVGKISEDATRVLFKPEVTGLLGVVAKALGKEPPAVRVWISKGVAPIFVKLEGPMYAEGPTWRVELAAPKWD